MSDYRAFPILYVDDEPQNLLSFRYALEGRFSVLTAETGRQALTLLEAHEVAVLVCDQRMPGMTGVEVCTRARELKPEVARIIMTAYSDVQTAVDAINEGHVFRYLTKPWHLEELVSVLDQAIDLVSMRRTIGALQDRVLRGTEPPLLEGVLRQVAAELGPPVAKLQMGREQVADLLEAGVSSWSDSERARELVEHARGVQSESERPIADLQEAVLRLERGQRLIPLPPPAVCDVGRVARAAVQIARATLDASTRLRLTLSATPAATIEANDLGQVLLHVIAHAARAVEQASDRAIEIEVREGGASVLVVVSHTGAVVTGDHLARAFDPYFALASGSTGVGLALVKQLVERAGGSVRVDPCETGGMRFTLRLPASEGLSLG